MTESLDKIRSALAFLDPDMSHEDWIRVGMALHSVGCDMSVFDEWSFPGKTYKASSVRDAWRSFKPGGGIGIATLYRMAQDAGWKPEPDGKYQHSAPVHRSAPAPAPVPERKPNAHDYTDYIEKCAAALFEPSGSAALEYLRGRGLTDGVLKVARVGYDATYYFPSLGRSEPVAVFTYNQEGTYFSVRNLNSDRDHRAFDKPKVCIAGDEPVYDPLGSLQSSDCDALFVCEAQIDALSVIVCGFPAVAIGGTGAGKLTYALSQNKPSYPLIYLADNDKPGLDFSKKVNSNLDALGIRHIVRTVPENVGKDANDFLRADPEGFKAFCARCVADAQEAPEPEPMLQEEQPEVYHWNYANGVDNILPDGFYVDDSGQWCRDVVRVKKVIQEVVVNHPWMLIERFESIGDGEIRFRCGWTVAGKFHSRIFTKAELTQARPDSVTTLANLGIDVGTTNAAQFVALNRALIAANLEALPVSRSTSKLGWIESENGLEFVPFTSDAVFTGSDVGIAQRGTVEEWAQIVKPAREYSKHLRLAMAVCVAAPMMHLCGLPGAIVVHLGGRTENGKTITQRVCASVYGIPEVGTGYVKSKEATVNWTEAYAAKMNHLPVILDENEVGYNDPKALSAELYRLSEGSGKGRATTSGEDRQQRTWNNAFLTSGESSLTSDVSKSGERNRVIELAAGADDLFPSREAINAVIDPLKKQYGTAARPLIEYLAAHADEISSEVSRLSLSPALASTGKQSLAAAVLLVGDRVLHDLFFPDEVAHERYADDVDAAGHLTPDAIRPFLADLKGVDQSEHAYDCLKSWYTENTNVIKRIGSARGEIFSPVLAVYDDELDGSRVLFISKSTLEDALIRKMRRNDIRVDPFLQAWASRGLVTTVHTDADGHHRYNTQRRFFKGDTRIYCYGIRIGNTETPDEYEDLPDSVLNSEDPPF